MENKKDLFNDFDSIFEDIESIPNSFFDDHVDDLNAFVDAMINAPEMKDTFNFHVTSMKNAGYSKEVMKQAFDNCFNEYSTNLMEHSNDRNLSEAKKTFLSTMVSKITSLIQDTIDDVAIADAKIGIELIDSDAKVPSYAHYGDAGADVYAHTTVTIMPGETTRVPLGFKVSIPFGWMLSVRPRSGMSLKTDVRISNAPGTIDSGYLDEVCIIMTNYGLQPYTIQKGDRIAQLVLEKANIAEYNIVDAVVGNDRGGGFGSTGK